MARKTSTRQILCALHRVCGMDMATFSYMLQTGRYINDPRITVALNARTIGDAVRAVSEYGRHDHMTFSRESVAALKKAGYITPASITRAKQIKRFADTKTLIRG